MRLPVPPAAFRVPVQRPKEELAVGVRPFQVGADAGRVQRGLDHP
jgi:hypothetical protein